MPMKTTLIVILLCLSCVTGCTQNAQHDRSEKSVGGPCETCPALWEYGNKVLTWVDTLPDFHEPGPKLEISGTIYQPDGKTPAKDVILYVYHTDQKGEYSQKGNEAGWGKKHGYIRGWIKTGEDGKYKLFTLRPGAYPGGGNPAHIHPVIKEPGTREYWIDEYLFDDDPYLTEKIRNDQQGRGGKGILKTKDKKEWSADSRTRHRPWIKCSGV